jgi:hypothetical protein
VSLTNGQQAGSYFARKRNRAAALVDDPTDRAWGTITFNSNAAQSVTLGGTVVTFDTDFALGADLAATLQALLIFLNASNDSNIKKATYSVSATSLDIRAKNANDVTFTVAASAGTVSHSALQLVQTRQRVA